MTLMPVSNISVFDSSWSNAGGVRWISQRSLMSSSDSSTSSGSPRVLNTWPLVTSPTGTVIGLPVSVTVGAADQAVGRLHRDGADQVVTEVLGDLEGQRLRPRRPG